MPDEKLKPLEELGLGEGLLCDPETGICEIPGAAAQGPQPIPTPAEKPKTEEGDR